MLELFQMWALVEVLGLIFLPLTITVFRNIPDRGWAWSKALAVLVVSFCVWLPLMLVPILPFSRVFILGVVLLLLALNVVGFLRTRHTIVHIIRANGLYILTTEAVFLGMVLLLGWLRTLGPEIYSYEMFMDEGFLASIMRSQHFPPHDMWYAGFSINYYYYAHYIVGMLAKLLGQIPSVAFNTGISMLYGLTAVSLFGVTSNLVSWSRRFRKRAPALQVAQTTQASFEALPNEAVELVKTGALHTEAVTVVEPDALYTESIAAIEPDVLHTESITAVDPDALQLHTEPVEAVKVVQSKVAELHEKPIYATKNALLGGIPFGLLTMAMGIMFGNMASAFEWSNGHSSPTGGMWWFNTTRVIPKTINEFPAFSFLLSDFHAHVLSLAFTILAIGMALNLLLEPEGEGLSIYGRGWRLPLTLGCTAISMGGLFVMNGWDLPTYLGLALVCISLQQWLIHRKRWSWTLLLDILSPTISLLALAVLLYLPFHINFISPSQGIGFTTLADRSSLRYELLIYGLLAFAFLSLLFSMVLARAFATPAASGQTDTQNQSGDKPEKYIAWSFLGTLLGLGFIAIGLICQVVSPQNATLFVALGIVFIALVIITQHIHDRTLAFAIFLGAIAFALIAGCEVVFLRDVFADNDPRMNTVFKFYFQAWIMLSIASGAGLYYILDNWRRIQIPQTALRYMLLGCRVLWTACLLVLVIASVIYPLTAPYYRFVRFNPITHQNDVTSTNSLDGLNYMKDNAAFPGDYEAIRWLNANISGSPVIVEAVGDDYTGYARVSALTGLPTIMGWVGHEYQWRVQWFNRDNNNAADFNSRKDEVSQIYSDPNPQRVLATMARYKAQYIYIGALERDTYQNANLNRFSSFMQVVYHSPTVTIYKLKP